MEVVSTAQTTREASVPSFACSVYSWKYANMRWGEKRKKAASFMCRNSCSTGPNLLFIPAVNVPAATSVSASVFSCESHEIEPNIQTPLYRIMWNWAIMHMRNWFTAARPRLAGKTVTVAPAGGDVKPPPDSHVIERSCGTRGRPTQGEHARP